ncbi:MAG: hypothetical protein HUU45_10375, partial [Leptospiraceae bacterium]|nr:hypothetical protein [Leptospiraceae bacterium]
FYIKDRGFIETKDLKVGDELKTANSNPLFISAIATNAREETVYNFEVEGNHTYFVGEDGVLVHNDSYGNNLNKVLGAYYSKDPKASARAELEKSLKDPNLSEAERTKLKADLAREKKLALKEGYSKRQGEYQNSLSGSENLWDKAVSIGKSVFNSAMDLIPSWGAKSVIDAGASLTGKEIKYGWGKNDPRPGGEGMDCSHFTNYVTNESRKTEGKSPIPYNTTESLLSSKDYKQIDLNSMKKGDQFVWRYDYTDKKGNTAPGGHTAFFNEKNGDKAILHSDFGHGPRYSNNYLDDPNWRKANPQYSNIRTYAIRVK